MYASCWFENSFRYFEYALAGHPAPAIFPLVQVRLIDLEQVRLYSAFCWHQSFSAIGAKFVPAISKLFSQTECSRFQIRTPKNSAGVVVERLWSENSPRKAALQNVNWDEPRSLLPPEDSIPRVLARPCISQRREGEAEAPSSLNGLKRPEVSLETL